MRRIVPNASWRGEYSPKYGWTCESQSPGATVAPRTSTSTSAGPFAPSALMRPSFTTTDPAAITGEVMSPLNRVPMLRKTVVVMSGDRAAELTRDVPADPRGLVGRVVTRVVTWVAHVR